MKSAVLFTGDCRQLMAGQGPFDLIIADPPYGETALRWDQLVRGWERVARECLKPSGSLWVFGSLKFFMSAYRAIRSAGFRVAQEIVWEKQNGTGFAADRFKRVHELVVQLVRVDSKWRDVYNDVQRRPYTGPDKHIRMRSANRTPHTGEIGPKDYDSRADRIVRSVFQARNSHRCSIHETEKPVSLLDVLVRTSCPPGGLVGDFFAGSGAAGEAAVMAGRRYIGCELDPDYAERARARLDALLVTPA